MDSVKCYVVDSSENRYGTKPDVTIYFDSFSMPRNYSFTDSIDYTWKWLNQCYYLGSMSYAYKIYLVVRGANDTLLKKISYPFDTTVSSIDLPTGCWNYSYDTIIIKP
jgi:hypothetical protein